MISIAVASVFVDDQDKALAFYTNVLGFEKRQDIPLGDARCDAVRPAARRSVDIGFSSLVAGHAAQRAAGRWPPRRPRGVRRPAPSGVGARTALKKPVLGPVGSESELCRCSAGTRCWGAGCRAGLVRPPDPGPPRGLWAPFRGCGAPEAVQVARTQVPSRRARPRPMRLRRFNAAVRRLSQALFLTVPRWRSLIRRPPWVATWATVRSTLGRWWR
jgi:Glyoxalase/Bleomycin resistance protein/Dioxygenase superfamily